MRLPRKLKKALKKKDLRWYYISRLPLVKIINYLTGSQLTKFPLTDWHNKTKGLY
jgi:hypothetical protein